MTTMDNKNVMMWIYTVFAKIVLGFACVIGYIWTHLKHAYDRFVYGATDENGPLLKRVYVIDVGGDRLFINTLSRSDSVAFLSAWTGMQELALSRRIRQRCSQKLRLHKWDALTRNDNPGPSSFSTESEGGGGGGGGGQIYVVYEATFKGKQHSVILKSSSSPSASAQLLRNVCTPETEEAIKNVVRHGADPQLIGTLKMMDACPGKKIDVSHMLNRVAPSLSTTMKTTRETNPVLSVSTKDGLTIADVLFVSNTLGYAPPETTTYALLVRGRDNDDKGCSDKDGDNKNKGGPPVFEITSLKTFDDWNLSPLSTENLPCFCQ